MLSAFISKTSSTTTAGFYNFIIGIITLLVTQFRFPYSTNFSSSTRFIWSFYPPNLLAEAISLLENAASSPQDPGVSWSGRTRCSPGDSDCVVTINKLYIWLISTFFLWFALALYFDNVIPNPYGVRKSAFYFLRPGYWTGKGGEKVKAIKALEMQLLNFSLEVLLNENTLPVELGDMDEKKEGNICESST